MNVDHRPDLPIGQLFELSGVEISRIADQGVDPAERGQRGSDDAFAAIARCHRSVTRHRGTAIGANFFYRPVGGLGACILPGAQTAEIVDDDTGATPRKLQAYSLPRPPPAPVMTATWPSKLISMPEPLMRAVRCIG